jgi:hypothetical protein
MASPQFADYRPLLNPDSIVIYPSRKKLLLMAVGSAAFVGLGFFFLFSADPYFSDWDVRAVGIASIAFFGLCLGFAVWRLARPSPALVIHSSGLFDHASALCAGFLPWDEISHLFVGKIKNQRFLGIAVKDVEGLLNRQTGWKAKLMRMNVRLAGSAVSIPANTLPISLEELIQKIQQKYPGIQVTT